MMPLKHKVIIVSLSLSTFLVMSTAYAYSEASAPLQMWFKAQSLLNQQVIDSKLQQEIVTARQALDESEEVSVARVGVHLEKVSEDAGHKIVSSIDSNLQSYTDELERTTTALSKSNKEDFEAYVHVSTSRIPGDIEKWADETIQDLTAKLGN